VSTEARIFQKKKIEEGDSKKKEEIHYPTGGV
jgi:hypothetical protein